MKYKIIAITALVVFGGCLPSLHPLYTPEDLVFKPELLGCWGEDNDETWTFAQDDKKSYTLTINNQGETGTFSAHLLTLDKTLYLDLIATDLGELDVCDFYKMSIYPVHIFMKVEQISPELTLTFMDPEWVEEYLKENPDELELTLAGDDNERRLITASTEQLQTFVKKHANNEDAWGDPGKLPRYSETKPQDTKKTED